MLYIKRGVKILSAFNFIFSINFTRMILSCVSTEHYTDRTYVLSHCLEGIFRNVHIVSFFNFIYIDNLYYHKILQISDLRMWAKFI
jgi:hypothetical protein